MSIYGDARRASRRGQIVDGRVVEVDEQGALYLAADLLEYAPPHSRFIVRLHGSAIVLHPAGASPPFWATAGPQERADDVVRWAARHADGPGLPDDALRRE